MCLMMCKFILVMDFMFRCCIFIIIFVLLVRCVWWVCLIEVVVRGVFEKCVKSFCGFCLSLVMICLCICLYGWAGIWFCRLFNGFWKVFGRKLVRIDNSCFILMNSFCNFRIVFFICLVFCKCKVIIWCL